MVERFDARFNIVQTIRRKDDIISLLKRAEEKGIDVIKTENLYSFDGRSAYSLGQGQ